MDDFDVRHAPALMTHVVRHDAKSFRFQLAALPTYAWVGPTVRKRGENQPITMQIGPY